MQNHLKIYVGTITGLQCFEVEGYARIGAHAFVGQQKNKREVDGYQYSGCSICIDCLEYKIIHTNLCCSWLQVWALIMMDGGYVPTNRVRQQQKVALFSKVE